MDKLPRLDEPRENNEYIIYKWNEKSLKKSKKATRTLKKRNRSVKRKNVKRDKKKKKSFFNIF